MDYKNAKENLSKLRDSLNEVLGSKSEGPSRKDAEDALKAAREGSKKAKKTLIGKIKDFPVVDKITQLGTAGTVAVSTAAVTQTNIAVDETEVFVASVANDAVQQRFYVPPILDRLVDFSSLDSWGQAVMQAKVAEVQAEVAKVEAKVAAVQAQETKAKTVTESQTTEETKSQEPQAQEESTNNSQEDGGDAEETKQDAEEVDSEEVKNKEIQETQETEESQESEEEQTAEAVPEENSDEDIDEVDEIKPHSEVESILPEDSMVVSPEGPRQA